MSDKTVTINSNFNSKKESNKTWQPVRNGRTFLKYLDFDPKLDFVYPGDQDKNLTLFENLFE